jgi:hypothetical protein
VIANRKEAVAINRNYICPNPSCGKPFAKPLKAINMALDNPEPYLACPHCLTEITTPENSSSPRTKPNLDTEPTHEETSAAEERTTQAPMKTRCTQHFGYLSERSNKEKIPEECITCTDIVKCMLKAVKNHTNN